MLGDASRLLHIYVLVRPCFWHGRKSVKQEERGRLPIQGQRTLNSVRRKDLHQELVAPAGDLALPLDAVL